MTPTTPTVLRSSTQVATQLGVHRRTVLIWAADGVLPHVRIGNKKMFHPDDIEAFIDSNRVAGDA